MTFIASKPLHHEALAGFKLMDSLIEPNIEELKLSVFANEKFVDKWIKEYPKKDVERIGLFVSQKSEDRALSQTKWEEIASYLSKEYEVFVYSNDIRDFEYAWHLPNGFIFPKTPTIQDLIASMTSLDYVICTDSAPLHFCSALSIPVVGLFENRIEKLTRWHPLNTKYELVYNARHIDSINTRQIIDAFYRLKNK
ncbi:glycosyltransferase family 9 protein [Thorsellia anophelis]|uniref:Glycosyltransferase family 9 (Heptosyltransferase) n=1 Tax=Thorsellia anophelis DSM 18579 TaxID=1123402 RepID=A0A1I0FLI3_9GAMM|nr:glycosyltransferase family 9 protein [Thorsellia anophelis]SET58120.1 Glycosyltransferase family 9 (heptosyltransferase) [Thorsellia anophelis DSM 18579]